MLSAVNDSFNLSAEFEAAHCSHLQHDGFQVGTSQDVWQNLFLLS